jgi:hypothetical protein
MKVGNAERSRYEAHIELAARHGVSSDMPLKVETSFHLPHYGSGDFASVVEILVSVEVPVRIIAESNGIERLGDVSWRDYHGYSDPFRRAAYYKVDADVPRLARSPSVGKDGGIPLAATDPFQLAKFLVEQCQQEIKGLSEETGTKLRDAVQDLVETRIRDGLASALLIVGRDGEVTMVRLADVPHYVVVESPYGGNGVDAAYCDVVIDRPDFAALNWQGMGLRFEPWETEIAGRVMRSYGIKNGPSAHSGIDFPSDAASDLAVANRCAMNALLPHFIKKVMLDLSNSELGKTSTVQAHTQAAYGAVARGEWGSEELDAALGALHDLWKYSPAFSELSRSKGWNCKLSPFEVMKARVEAFPWRGPDPGETVERSQVPAL